MARLLPSLKIACTAQLLAELHEAHDALQRSLAKRKQPTARPQLEQLIVAIGTVRLRVGQQRLPIEPID